MRSLTLSLALILTTVAMQAAVPSIQEQTETVYIWSGQSDELTLDVPNGVSYTYQWYEGVKGDTAQPLEGATQLAYTTPSLTATAQYWVRLSNAEGDTDSETMTIIPVSSIAELPRSEQFMLKLPDEVGINPNNVADKFLLYLPETFDAAPKLPLYLHLHGAGNQNDHVSGLFVNSPGPEFTPGNEFQFIAARPRSNGGWNRSQLNLLLNYLKDSYKVDHDRVYISGFSMGAAGVWGWALSELESGRNTFAAVAVMAGNTGSYGRSLELAASQAAIPFWIFHGDQDQTVNPRPAVQMSEYLTRSGSEARFTIFPGFRHGIAGEPQKIPDDGFLRWMSQQRRGQLRTPSGKILSVNFNADAVNAQTIDSGETFGVESLGTVVGNWNNTSGIAAAGSLLLDDGTTSAVALSSVQPEGLKDFSAGPHTAMQAGILRTPTTTGPVSVTLENVSSDFPDGYYAIVYLTGQKPTIEFPLGEDGQAILNSNGKNYEINRVTSGNTGATISDGNSTFYFQSPDLMDSAMVRLADDNPVFTSFNFPLQRAHEQALPTGTFPEATFAVFGPYTADSVTFTLDSVTDEDAAIGGIQIFDLEAVPLSPDPAAFLTVPLATSQTEVAMTAVVGLASSGAVEYRFTETTGNYGGTSSEWQSDPNYTDTGLLPETNYAYTVTMRDTVGTVTEASDVVAVTTPAYATASSPVVLGWHSFDAATPASDSTPDIALAGVSGSISGGRDSQTNEGSNDGSFGTFEIPGNPGTSGRIRVRTLSGEETVTLTITNGTGSPLSLDQLFFDYSGFANAPAQLDIAYTAGDLTDSLGTSLFSSAMDLSGGGISGNFPDYAVDLTTALTDPTLADAESATFEFVFSNGVTEMSAGALDNIALTQAAGADRDGDGIPTDVEESWGLNPDLTADGALDLDGDGQSNYAEYVAGTNGNDPRDQLRVDVLGLSETLIDLGLSHAPEGRLTILEESADPAGPWIATQVIEPGSPIPRAFQSNTGPSPRFFRIRILKTP